MPVDLLDRFLAQVGALQDVWMPFLLAVFIVGFAIWKVVQWQHGVRVTHLTSQLDLYRETSSVTGGPPVGSTSPSDSRSSAPLPPLIDTMASEQGKRIFVEEGITISTLRTIVNGADSTLGAQRAVAAFEGKWFRISGVVKNLALVGTSHILVVVKDDGQDSDELPTTNLFFSSHVEIDAAEMMRKPIRAVGRFNGASAVALNFWDCELEG